MEPVTTAIKVAEIAKKGVEVAKKIQKVYDVSQQMKNVAESEGKDKLQAISKVTTSASKFFIKEMKGLEKNGNMQGFNNLQSKLESQSMHGLSKPDMLELKGESPNESLKERHSVFDKELPSENEYLSKQEVYAESKTLEKKENSIFVEDMPSAKDKILKSGDLDESMPIEKLASSEKLDVNINVSKSEVIPQPENVANSGLTEERSNNTNPIETAEKQSHFQENTEAQHSIEISKDIEQRTERLTDEQKIEIKLKTGWSDAIIDSIRSMDEAQIYIDAGLQEGEVNGKLALLQSKIDGNACNEPKWPDWTNKALAEDGYPPRDEAGRPYELHHIGQNPESPLAELTYDQHHCNGNFIKLHTFDESSIDRQQFNKERKEYWETRSQTL